MSVGLVLFFLAADGHIGAAQLEASGGTAS